jgi:hypothetical protein
MMCFLLLLPESHVVCEGGKERKGRGEKDGGGKGRREKGREREERV